MAFSFSLDQVAGLAVVAEHRDGSAASVQDAMWSSSNEAVVSVVDGGFDAATGQYSASAVSVSVGEAQVAFSGDADLGDGVKPVSFVYDLVVTQGSAVFIRGVDPVISDKA